MNPTQLAAWLNEWAALWCVDDLIRQVQVEPGRRLRRSLGRCQPETGDVRIHPALFDPQNADLFREVVCHEVAHAAVYMLHGRKVRPHGREWKLLVAAAGYEPSTKMDPRRLPRRLQVGMAPKTLYRHSCPVCGATRSAGRRVANWRCRACHESGLEGRLQIVSVPKAENP